LPESVTGSNITQGLATLSAKGLETGQNKAVVIVFDKAQDNLYVERTIQIVLQTPMDAATLGTPPFNPFIFVNKTRGREIHLIDQVPTNKMNTAFFNTQDDKSNTAQGKYYQTSNKLPWALNFLETFDYPKEMKPINQGYIQFNSWAESGGSNFNDWYKDKPGYRNATFLSVESQ
jgi:LruC domain-containing protein